jgi:prepilin-type N-terminal cleavage/methylation domain-containing protein
VNSRSFPNRFRTTQRGFTLIELLIVVAIVSIMGASSMMLITAPAAEAAKATSAQVRLAGETSLHQALVRDAHQSLSVRALNSPDSGLEFLSAQSDTNPNPGQILARYTVLPEGQIRRESPNGSSTRTFDLGRPARLSLVTASATQASLTLGFDPVGELTASIPATTRPTSSMDTSVTLSLALLPAILGPSSNGTPQP